MSMLLAVAPDLAATAAAANEAYILWAIVALGIAVVLVVVELFDMAFGPLDRIGENVAKVAAVVVVLLPKFAGYRDIVFRRALREKTAAEVGVTTDDS